MPPVPLRQFTRVEDVLQFYLTYSPPDHALWKSIEWRLFREYSYVDPVLDLGCGDGVFAHLVFGRPLAAGIDILPGRVRRAMAARAHQLPVTGDATRMPFASTSFSTVFSGCAMEHVPPLPQMLAEITRVLRPGGRLITTVPSGYFSEYLAVPRWLRRRGIENLASWYGHFIPQLMTMVHLYHPAYWQRLLEQAGLQLVEARHFLSQSATVLFDKLLIIGNMMQPITETIRGSGVHRRYVAWLHAKLLPYVYEDASTGGALLLVAQKAA